MATHSYKVFGLKIKSEIELPELLPTNSMSYDVLIKLGNVEEHLERAVCREVLYETASNDFIFKIDAIARYRVKDGNTIYIQPCKEALEEVVRLFLFGSAFGALLHQREILPLHGSAVLTKHGAIVFIGFSSVGKSTLAASFAEAGYEVISDDITAISKNPKGKLRIYRGIPYLKLWKDVLPELKLEVSLARVRPKLEKYKFPTKFKSAQHSFPIDKIVLLETHNDRIFKSEQISGTRKFSILKTHTYRFNYIEGMGCSEFQFKNLSIIANEVVVHKLSRPLAPIMIKELREFVTEKLIDNCEI